MEEKQKEKHRKRKKVTWKWEEVRGTWRSRSCRRRASPRRWSLGYSNWRPYNEKNEEKEQEREKKGVCSSCLSLVCVMEVVVEDAYIYTQNKIE